jgi:TRAP-type mannitol/chloroaromatic compound transport system permease small subunit
MTIEATVQTIGARAVNQTTSEPAAGVAAGSTPDAGVAEESPYVHYLTAEEMPAILRFSEMLRRFVDRVGRFGAWFAMPLILITTFDMIIRKIYSGKVQIWLVENVSPYFGSTLLQELEWHSHTVLFALVLGFGYIWNTHVRVDLVRENLAFRKKAWLEFIGLTIFLIPFTSVVVYFAAVYAYDSWAIGEISASLVGLHHRWVIKTVLVVGLVVAIIAGIAVWLQVAVALFGPQHWRYPLMTLEWPEETGTTIEGKERLDLDKAEDLVEARAAQRQGASQGRTESGA